MKYLKTTSALLLIIACLVSASWANAAGIGNNISVRLVGTSTAYDGTALFNDFDIALPAEGPIDCFDVDLVDAKTGNVIGTAADCLTDISLSESDNGALVTGTTFFFFPGGTIVSRGLTTVQPVLHGSANFTHITGAIPDPSDDSIRYGDGKFQNADGPVRLSGTVNLGSWGGPGTPTPIEFDCLFILSIK
jgi:hypothetical protein